jgi:hypothetical protein
MALPEVGDFFTTDLHGSREKGAVMHLTRAGDFLYEMFFLGNPVGRRLSASQSRIVFSSVANGAAFHACGAIPV